MTFKTKESRLLLILSSIFVADAVLSEFIGVKIFNVEETLGFQKFNMNLLGVPNLSFNMSAGVITWPIIFIITDIINEYFGLKQIRFLSILAAVIIAYTFLMTGMAIHLQPSDFWIQQNIKGVNVNMDAAFTGIFGQGMWIIVGSITAFITAQILDVVVFHSIKKVTGEKKIWLRATGSTVISQLVDSFVVIFIAFYLNPEYHWSWQMVAAIGLVNYSYKFVMAILMTPILYAVHWIIDRYLGKNLAHQLMKEAQNQ